MEDKSIKSGSCRESLEISLAKRSSVLRETKIEFADYLIATYTAFRDQVYNPQSVLYPSCGFDASPAKVFDKVTFVDVEDGNNGCVAKLQEAGFHALKEDIRTYPPKDLHDLLILLNPAIPTEWASRHLRPGGYIIANNWHSNASEMYRQPDQFALEGVIDLAKKEGVAIFSKNIEGLFEPVKNEDELKQLRPEYYSFLLKMFRTLALNGNFNDKRPFEQVWTDYRKLMREGMPSKRVAGKYVFVKK